MKRVIVLLIFTTIGLTACSQSGNGRGPDKETSPMAVAYRLYPTQNMWTFIKLNTRTGQMWQVQFDVQGNNRHEVYLNLLPLVGTDNERNDRFALYPTQNIYTFLLLDQFNGKQWQVQWSQEAETRGIIPIE